ncbi:MAG TPA: PepSY-associated TM helix domain-containing protein [Gammaproteobacteria bacterium]|nr:PepSY-associated TM helix domain-containing protein [Gammaproteobacteria bacterium]
MSSDTRSTAWRRWARQPQKVWLRRAIFQVHLWSGVGVGLYVFFISVTGSVLVYANELLFAATPEPIISQATTPRLGDDELAAAAVRSYPGYRVTKIMRPTDPDQAVEVWLERAGETEKRLFDPRTGADVGSAFFLGVVLVSKLIELHDDLLAGPTGRHVNGGGALAVLLLALTGGVIWWPGIARWRRSLTLHRGVGWKRFVWDLHSATGFWCFAAVLVFALSGLYLCYPASFQALADRLQPPTAQNAGHRFVDGALYWLAYLHFGRIYGIGIPCAGPGLCDQATKAVWALFGLAPAAMFVTGAIMWWNRVLRPRLAGSRGAAARADRSRAPARTTSTTRAEGEIHAEET